MTQPPFVPPLKCQGIKTKLVSEIARFSADYEYERWVEPFCGSCVVPLNVQPRKALLCDTNLHIIRLYKDIQSHVLTPPLVREFLFDQGETLRRVGEGYYYEVRARFNLTPNSFDFLFLNRSCFNGVMRFNRSGGFNVPFGHKPERFAQAYITKIYNQVRRISEVIDQSDWEFRVADFRETLSSLRPTDFVYADPPYLGRHVDYFNSWSETDENDLAMRLKQATCKFILSTWHSNQFRTNELVEKNWEDTGIHVFLRQHFYHVGSTENLRHPMTEALISNFALSLGFEPPPHAEQLSFAEALR